VSLAPFRWSIVALAFLGRGCIAQSTQEPMKIGSVTMQGSIRSRVEGWRWFEGQGDLDYAFSGTELRLAFKKQSERFDWQLELEAPVPVRGEFIRSRGNRCLVQPATVLLPAIRGKTYRRPRSARIRQAAS